MADSELILPGDLPASTLSRRVQEGKLRRLARGVYAPPGNASAEELIRRNWTLLVARRHNGAVVTDRSARRGGPDHNGLLFIAATRERIDLLPGLSIVARAGPELPSDIPLGHGLHLASTARGLVDNTARSRSRNGRPPRTFNEAELADWIDWLAAHEGPRFTALREECERVAAELDIAPERNSRLSALFGAAMGSRRAATESRALRARQIGSPYDADRILLFEAAADRLRDETSTLPVEAIDAPRRRLLPFFEAYFSNFIEGTEFTLDEAAAIALDGNIPAQRPHDAHDIIGTFSIVADELTMKMEIATADQLVEQLRARHATLVGQRFSAQPGRFKTHTNRAGETVFVAPELVEGTLRHGFEIASDLRTPTQRGIYIGLLLTEVHPFADGNGRIARIFMNGEFVHGDETRLIVPTIARNDYLNALRRFSRRGDVELFIAVIQRLRRYVARVNFDDIETARRYLTATNAFTDANDAERRGLHLLREPPSASEGTVAC